MIEKIVGVEHGALGEFNDLKSPSSELIRYLASRPKGTKVGLEKIEYIPPEFSGLQDFFYEPDGYYFNRVEEECTRLGHEVVGLDTWQPYEKIREISKKREEAENETGLSFEKLRTIYACEIEAEHAAFIERDDFMKNEITTKQPDVVVLGAGHVFPLMTDTQMVQVADGSLVAFCFDMNLGKNPPQFVPELIQKYGKRVVENELVDAARIYPLIQEIVFHRELLRRRYTAVTKGRIDINAEPSFIGTFDRVVPARGLFEVFCQGEAFSGGIVDVYGDSDFYGTTDGEEVVFVKEYVRSDKSAYKGKIVFRGEKSNGIIIGKADLPNESQLPFVMVEGSDSTRIMNWS